MRKTLLTLTLFALAQTALADETPTRATSGQPTAAVGSSRTTTKPRPALRVLQDPYDLASYYRSGGSAPGGWAGLTRDPAYSIASMYRAEGGPSPYGWSSFWTSGYSARRPLPFAPYRRTIGQNGDLFLMVPFLAPVGPISGAFAGY